MKHLYLLLLSSLPLFSISQTFVRITDGQNPIVSDPPNSTLYNASFNGSAWMDINNDHWLDLFHNGWLYLNNAGNGFIKLQSFANPANGTSRTSCSWMDMDNDGFGDLIYSNTQYTRIYRNNGDSTFTQWSSVLDNINSQTWSVQWCDYNNDTWADLILTFADGFFGSNHQSNRLFRGSSNGTFSIVTDTFEFLTALKPFTVSYWSDYDEDGDQDLFIASGPGGSPGPDFHYKNLVQETGIDSFERITGEPYVSDPQDGQCYNWIDFDNDEDLDLCVTNWTGAPNWFYRNDTGNLDSIATPFTGTNGVPALSNGWGDFDNDGFEDVLITAGGSGQQAGFYHNNGDGTFATYDNIIFTSLNGSTAGLSIGDYDNDGDLDFFTVGMEKGLFQNHPFNNNAWVNFTLIGTASNTSAIGTIVKLKATIGGQSMWQHRQVSTQNTFMGQNSQRVHFGLGDATTIDSLIVRWPSGNEEVFESLDPKRFYRIEEITNMDSISFPKDSTVSIGSTQALEVKVFPNPVDTELRIEGISSAAETIEILATDGSLFKTVPFTSPSNTVTVDVKALKPGSYILRITTGRSTWSKSFIKK